VSKVMLGHYSLFSECNCSNGVKRSRATRWVDYLGGGNGQTWDSETETSGVNQSESVTGPDLLDTALRSRLLPASSAVIVYITHSLLFLSSPSSVRTLSN
jgi:hypothetical protein